MTVQEKIDELRRIMSREKLSAYIISGTDPHNSEYLPRPWQQRKWFSGFTGSFGTIVITMNHVGIWTDTRYFIQVDKELKNTGIELHKLRVPDAVDYPQWLSQNLTNGDCVGFDGFCMSVSIIKNLEMILAEKNISIKEQTDLLGEIWLDRPALPDDKITILSPEYSGETTLDKLSRVKEYINSKNGNFMLFNCLDEIAWLYNIRGKDIPYNPVIVSYAIVENTGKAHLFIKHNKLTSEIEKELQQENIEIHDYNHLFLFLESVDKEKTFLIDTNTCNYAVYSYINKRFNTIDAISPIPLMKSIKNPVEIEGFRQACIKDGVALTKFFYWIEQNIGKVKIDELTAAAKLSEFRSQNEQFVSDSFNYISAYGANAALPHYSANEQNVSELKPKGFYLIDSGGQYLHGTTDITRTIPLGELTDLEKEDYTLVLKGMIDLSMLIFPKPTRGANIDIIARLPLYMNLRNYGHGTGHGVGHYLNVHEGPQDIRQDLKNQEILPGMVTSNEPGMYREGLHGVRHENLIVCQPKAKNEFGEFFNFETITLCYFDTKPILVNIFDNEEIIWLNSYNKYVFDKLSPYLKQEEKDWLENKTQPITL